MRPFRYAVPLAGLSNEDTGRLIEHTDFGITSSDHNDPTNMLIQQLTKDVDKDSWAADVPKVYGVVVARSPIEAEAHALRRARFAADLLTFALQTGASHFDTVHETQRLNWSARDSIATVSTRPLATSCRGRYLEGLGPVGSADICRQECTPEGSQREGANILPELSARCRVR